MGVVSILVGCGGGEEGRSSDASVGGMYQFQGEKAFLAPGAQNASVFDNSHPNSCPDSCPSNRPYYQSLESGLQQRFADQSQAPCSTDQPLHELARGICKHFEMHPPSEGWTTESPNASTTPEGWTLADRFGKTAAPWDPSRVYEVLVTFPASGDASKDVNVAYAQIRNKIEANPTLASAASQAVAVGAGAWQAGGNGDPASPVVGDTRVSLIFARP